MIVYNLSIGKRGIELGTIINGLAIIIGGALGLVFKKGLPNKLSTNIMNGLALCVLYIGISGSLKSQNTLMLILSMVIGVIIGEALDLDGQITKLGEWVEKKVQREKSSVSISEGFVTASLLFCVGAMAIVGSIQEGLTGNREMLLTKSMLDGISSIIFSSSLGVGVIFSGGLVLIYQGGMTGLASVIAPFLTEAVINEMAAVGSLLIIGLSLNMLKMTNLKIMNFVPAIFIPIFLGLWF